MDQNLGRRRPTSNAFNDDKDGSPLSATIANEAPGTHVLLNGHPSYGIAVIEANWLRAGGQKLIREPEEGNPAHIVVVGSKKDKKFRDELARRALILVMPARCLGPPPPNP